jgi:hypothetical protein
MLLYLLAAVTTVGHPAAAEVRKLPARVAAAFALDDIIGKAVITIIVAGVLGAFWLGIKIMLGKSQATRFSIPPAPPM